MNAHIAIGRSGLRHALAALVMAAVAATSAGFSPAAVAADPSPQPAAVGSPGVETAEGKTLCQSADDLRLIVGFLSETSISEEGVVPVVVGVIAGLSEARTLAGIVDETYRPLVEDLSGSLGDLRTTVETRGELATAGAQIAAIGEAITAVGNAMDALSVQLQTPCPVADQALPEASAEPAG
jgi:hypothetical protein